MENLREGTTRMRDSKNEPIEGETHKKSKTEKRLTKKVKRRRDSQKKLNGEETHKTSQRLQRLKNNCFLKRQAAAGAHNPVHTLSLSVK